MRTSFLVCVMAVLALALWATPTQALGSQALTSDASTSFEEDALELSVDEQEQDAVEEEAADEQEMEEEAEDEEEEGEEEEAEEEEEEEADEEEEEEADEEEEEEEEELIAVEQMAHLKAFPPAVFFIRHGEKPYPDNKELSERGRKRAAGLAGYFAKLAQSMKVKIEGVYAQRSAFDQPGRKGPTSKRPVDTVVPLAQSLKLQVQKYWPEDYGLMAQTILKAGKTAVISWEHDALTDVAKQFGVKLVWPEGRYDVTYVLTWPGGKPKLTTTFQNLLPGDMNHDGPVPASVFIVPCDTKVKADAQTVADQAKWKNWFGGSYALQNGGVRTVVAQKGCKKEIKDVAEYLEAKFITDLEKPKDVSAAAQSKMRENGVVLIVAERQDIGKITSQLKAKETPYTHKGAGVTLHLLYEPANAPKVLAVKHT